MDLVQLDVGGMLYKVALDTLMRHPDTMLAKLVSEIWRGSPCAQGDPIFIDRDKDLFKYILEWYRDDTIIIPRTVAIAALRNEVRFFSLPDDVVIKQEKLSTVECCEGMKIFQPRDENTLFAAWGLEQAIKEGYLKNSQVYKALVKEYQDLKPSLDMNEALEKSREKIRECGLESFCTVGYPETNSLTFVFK
jgi:hypothetical protein